MIVAIFGLAFGICTGMYIRVYKSNVYLIVTDLFNPLVPKGHNVSGCQNILFPLQIKPLKAIFCTFGPKG